MDDCKVKTHYKNIASTYDESRFNSLSGNILHHRQVTALDKCFKGIPKDTKILEIGCGTGRFIQYLSSRGYHDLYGIDQSQEMIEIAREKSSAYFIAADIYNLPFKNKHFDVAFSIHVLMHLAHPYKALGEMIRIARQNVIFDINNPHSLGRYLIPLYRFFYKAKTGRALYVPNAFSQDDIRSFISAFGDVVFIPSYFAPLKGYLPKVYFVHYASVEAFLQRFFGDRIASQFLTWIRL